MHCPSLALLLPDRDSRRFCNWERPEWLSARGPRYGSDLKRIEEAPRALTPSSMQRQCPQSMNPSPFKHESFCAVLLNVRLGVVLNVVSLRSSSYCLALGVTISIMSPCLPPASQGWLAVLSRQYKLDKPKLEGVVHTVVLGTLPAA